MGHSFFPWLDDHPPTREPWGCAADLALCSSAERAQQTIPGGGGMGPHPRGGQHALPQDPAPAAAGSARAPQVGPPAPRARRRARPPRSAGPHARLPRAAVATALPISPSPQRSPRTSAPADGPTPRFAAPPQAMSDPTASRAASSPNTRARKRQETDAGVSKGEPSADPPGDPHSRRARRQHEIKHAAPTAAQAAQQANESSKERPLF